MYIAIFVHLPSNFVTLLKKITHDLWNIIYFWILKYLVLDSIFFFFLPSICKTEKETQMYRTDFWTLWEKARVGWSERTASKHVYYQVWNRRQSRLDAWDKCSGLVHWDDPEGWDGEGGGRGVQDGECIYTCGWFMSMYGRNHYNIVK